MSRLEEECIMYVGRNRSGVDSGDLDYGVFIAKFERLNIKDLERAIQVLDTLQAKCVERMANLQSGPK